MKKITALFVFLAATLAIFTPIYLWKNKSLSVRSGEFHGEKLVSIPDSMGFVLPPTPEQKLKGGVLHAYLKAAALEQITNIPATNRFGLELTVSAVDADVLDCQPDGNTLANASFVVSAKCSPNEFGKSKAQAKTTLIVDSENKLIIFGSTQNSTASIYYGKFKASFIIPAPMPQNQSLIACEARAMLDFIFQKQSTSCKI